ncbi:hypothetical protein MMC25_003002 [Agyrium rufum]|nr:hypothetical protein [Agyrium rufum]
MASRFLRRHKQNQPAKEVPTGSGGSRISDGKDQKSRSLASTDKRHDIGTKRSENPMRSVRHPRTNEAYNADHPIHDDSFGLGITSGTVHTSEHKRSDSNGSSPSRLRRKKSSIDNRSLYARSEINTTHDHVSSHPAREAVSLPGDYHDFASETILGIGIPVSKAEKISYEPRRVPTAFATSNSRMEQFMAKQLPHKLSTQDLTPPTPNFTAKSSSASTRYSVSPGAFSRTSTPTSVSSYSPAVQVAARNKPRQSPSPAKPHPPVTHRRGVDTEAHELSALLEAAPPDAADISQDKTLNEDAIDPDLDTSLAEDSRVLATTVVPPLRTSSKRLPKSKQLQTGNINPGRQTESEFSNTDISRLGTQPSKTVVPLSVRYESPRKAPLPPPKNGKGPLTAKSLTAIPKLAGPDGAKTSAASEDPKAVGSTSSQAPKGRTPSSAASSSRIPIRSPLLSPNGVPAVTPPFRRPLPPVTPLPEIAASRRVSENLPQGTTKKPSSKLNIFSRKTKGDTTGEKPDRLVKKGPAAGTGHEGYGKYARRGRTTSISSASSRGRPTTDDGGSDSSVPPQSRPWDRKNSFASQSGSELDDFYKDRLEPVVIGGGGRIVENRNSSSGFYRVTSGESLASVFSSVESLPALTKTVGRSTPMKLGLPISPRDTEVIKRFPPGRREAAQIGEKQLGIKGAKQPTLAARRSFTRSRNFKDLEPLKVPLPIDVSASKVSPSMGSYDTLISAAPNTDSSLFTDDATEVYEPSWQRTRRLFDRAKLSKKGNFFKRAQGSPRHEAFIRAGGKAELYAAVAEVPDLRPVAHYCMLDDPDQEIRRTLEDLLHDIEDDLDLGNMDQSDKNDDLIDSDGDVQVGRQPSLLLPPPPKLLAPFSPSRRSSPAEVPLRHQEAKLPTVQSVEDSPSRNSRLAQVGRIPKVVSKRDHTHKPPPHSFSRPFHREEYPVPQHHGEVVEEMVDNRLKDDVYVPTFTATESTEPSQVLDFTGQYATESDVEKEFLSFSPRKNSAVTTSTSSSGMMSFSAITAIRPNSSATLDEDEIWDEFDDLLDRATFPYTAVPGILAPTTEVFDAYNSHHLPIVPEPLNYGQRPKSRESYTSLTPVNSPHVVQVSSTDIGSFPFPPTNFVVLRGPLPVTDNLSDLSRQSDSQQIDRVLSNASKKSRISNNTLVSKSGSQSSRGSRRSIRARSYQQILEHKARNTDHARHNLRLSAVLTSRWLTLNRVLFSPVHDEVEASFQDRILVLDGLGNDDWSSYCAVTYPDAIIYNLGSRGSHASKRRESGSYQPLANHRQIQYAGADHPFPFPKGFFAAVTLRFPAVNSEAAYYNTICEAKRVLRPGGYLELNILDMDLVNMGNRTRRAVRQLKTSMQAFDSSISLSPMSDVIQKMLGRRGFENLNRCAVGIPVAGMIESPRKGSLSEFAEGEQSALGNMLRQSGGSAPTGDVRGNPASQTMAAESSSTALLMPPMSKMVAQVGRWWWSQCYETYASKRIDDADTEVLDSIWNDMSLLRECEGRETGFKLLVCYAQKPSVVRRRTVSV